MLQYFFLHRFDPETKQWNFIAPMTTARSTVGVAVLNGRLYAVGGRDGSACLNSVGLGTTKCFVTFFEYVE